MTLKEKIIFGAIVICFVLIGYDTWLAIDYLRGCGE